MQTWICRRARRTGIAVPAVLALAAAGFSLPASAQQLELTREIGVPDGPPEYTFFQVSSIARGPAGEVVVLDGGAKSVVVYDTAGSFLRRFGGEGDGPGEFRAPVDLRVEGDDVLVSDWRLSRRTRFTMEGEVLETVPLPQPADLVLTRAYVMADGSTVGTSVWRAAPGSPQHDPYVRVVRIASGTVDTLLTIEPGYVIWSAPEGMPWGVAPETVGRTGAVAVSGDSAIALVDANRSRLRVIRVSARAFRPLRPVTIPIHARPVSPARLKKLEAAVHEEIESAPDRVELIPPTATSDLTGHCFFDDEGAVWIETRAPDPDSERRWMVIARRPGTSRWVPTPGSLELKSVEGGLAYGVWRDEMDVETVRIYRLGQPTHASTRR